MTPEYKLKKKCREWVFDMYQGRLVHVSPKGADGYPDSDLLIPECPIVKIEFKRAPSVVLRPAQERWREWFTKHGFIYWQIGSFDDFYTSCKYLVGRYGDLPPTPAGRGRSMVNG